MQKPAHCKAHGATGIFYLGSSDFKRVLNTSAFVDKTLLIKCLFEDTDKLVITAPHRFGKSTNLDMVKRFLEIQVNDEGHPINVLSSSNYNLFMDNNLKICKQPEIIEKHLGKHPVIFIDLKPLSILEDFDDMLAKFQLIFHKTFLQHEYLLNNPKLWIDEEAKQAFIKYIHPTRHLKITKSDLTEGLEFLSRLLYKHFNKHVFVLVDEYDSYVHSFIFKKHPDMDAIIRFTQGILDELLKTNSYVDRALLTGIMAIVGTGLFPFCNNLTSHSFLRDHQFLPYYGFTTSEVNILVNKFARNAQHKKLMTDSINEWYEGYTVINENYKIFSTCSILQFLQSQQVSNYWCHPEYLDTFKSFFLIPDIREEINKLIVGNTIYVNISHQFSKKNIATLTSVKLGEEPEEANSASLFFYFLYDIGYLTLKRSNISDTELLSAVPVTIPNHEIFIELTQCLQECYLEENQIDSTHIQAIYKCINSLSLSSSRHSFFALHNSLEDLFVSTNFMPMSEAELQLGLLVFLSNKFAFTRPVIYKRDPQEYVGVLVVNDAKIVIIIECKYMKSEEGMSPRFSNQESAFESLKDIVRKNYLSYLDYTFLNDINGRIYIGLGIDFPRITMAYLVNNRDLDNVEYAYTEMPQNYMN